VARHGCRERVRAMDGGTTPREARTWPDVATICRGQEAGTQTAMKDGSRMALSGLIAQVEDRCLGGSVS
jgi:hypothetical protein